MRRQYLTLEVYMVPVVENLPASGGDLQETRVLFLGQEDLLEEMATHFSILDWKSPQTKDPGGLQSMASQRLRHD